MATELHTFVDIFEKEIECRGERIALRKIVIPIIQRDYAQGRISTETDRIRTRFLNALYRAVTEEPVTLDFIYGDIDANGVMTPLDGQQRLTTLFLLHWYAAKKAGVCAEEYGFLRNFSYRTRYSARDFCTLLIDYQPTFEDALSHEIIDQPWFPLSWKKDQTIASMLVMLDAISKQFADVPDLWSRLKGGAVSFFFLPIRDMGLTDELYIKMNSRGKPLTTFEHFKAELERDLRGIDSAMAERIMRKVDVEWTDMLWHYRGDDNVTDDEFLRYFRFLCDVLCYRGGGTPQGKSGDEFDLLEAYFSPSVAGVNEHIKTLEAFFDCWTAFSTETPTQFLERVFTHKHAPGTVMISTRYDIDIFSDCLHTYADIIGRRNRRFPLNRFVILYAVILYLLNKDSISEAVFIRRLRVINNLVQNSEYEISDSENRQSGNRMPAILKQTDSVMLTGAFDDRIEKSFNVYQIEEEKRKLEWCKTHPRESELLFEVEDHRLLNGQIGIIGLDDTDLFRRFQSLFNCNMDAIDCALLTCGPYLQMERNGSRYQLGSALLDSAWIALFHRSSNSRYAETQAAIAALLRLHSEFSTPLLREISDVYLRECEEKHEYDWRYYYIKYPAFRPAKFGKYSWDNFQARPYEFYALWTERAWSSNARQPFLYAIDPANIYTDDNGRSLRYGEKIVRCLNAAFVIYDLETRRELARLPIAQNADGIDTEDRIIKGNAGLPALIQSVT